MSLVDGGIYQIRYVPANIRPPFVGGSYATGKDINAPILGEALSPSVQGVQNWKVTKVQGKQDTYIIGEPGFRPSPINLGPGPVLAGWGANQEPSAHHDLVQFSVGETEWIVQAEDGANTPEALFSIARPSPPGFVGANFYVDLDSHTRALYLKAIPVIREMPPAPLWQFTPVNDQ